YAVCADEAFLAGSAGRALTAAAIDVSLQAILHSVGARRCRDAGAGAVASLAGAASCPGDHIRARSRLNARHGLETALAAIPGAGGITADARRAIPGKAR